MIKGGDNAIAPLIKVISDSLVNSKSFDDISTKLYTFAKQFDSRFLWHINVGLKGFTDLNTVDFYYIVASVGDIFVKIQCPVSPANNNNTHNAFDIRLI